MSWSAPVYHEALGIMYSRNTNGWICTEDKVMYSPIELQHIRETIGSVTSEYHDAKRAEEMIDMVCEVFNGEIHYIRGEQKCHGVYRPFLLNDKKVESIARAYGYNLPKKVGSGGPRAEYNGSKLCE
ncbi:hypothetical protein [Oceanispirochaeta sp.]|jgi:hypothetical protein|uniref:hypothetical protein n=1 Tax=Oceanispirochaeta sp. TaxID=2035350 RepID=UPI00261EA35E|nr:hypothetical protein [Oceanispirochaeta sp.]MDA3958392.1 hypothetical protein [Oceanispirochaeta sp.]